MFVFGFVFTLTALAWTSLAMSAASTAGAVYSKIQQGKAAKAKGKADAAGARAEADRREILTRENMRRERSMNRRHLSTQKAKFAASGIQLRGTPLSVQGQTAGELELNVLDMAFKASEQSRKLELQAKHSEFEGKAAYRAAKISAGASLLSGASKAAGGLAGSQQSGAIK